MPNTKIESALWAAEHITSTQAGQSLQRCVAGFADCEATKAAMQDLANAGPWRPAQLVQIRWLIIQIVIEIGRQRARAQAASLTRIHPHD